MTNPLLLNEKFPRYDLIKPEHFVPAVKEVIEISKKALA